MATYTTRNRLIKQATAENKGAWGTYLNAGLIDMLDEAMDGITTLSMSGNVTLTDEDGATDQARKRIINITSTGGSTRTITIPAVEKVYTIRNAGAQYVTVKTAAGTGVIVLPGVTVSLFCDATDCYKTGQSGFGLISTTAYTPASSNIDVTLTGFGCSEFWLWCEGLSTSSVASTIGIGFSANGSSYTTAATIATFSAISDTYYGGIALSTSAFTAGGTAMASLANLTSDATSSAMTPVAVPWRRTAGGGYIRLSNNSGGSAVFDAGSVYLYGR